MIDPRWLECDTCQNCRSGEQGRFCLALGVTLAQRPVVECELWRELPDLTAAAQAQLAKRYSGLY